MEKDFKEKVIRAAQITWDIIGDDCLVDEDGKPDLSVTMSKDEVIEMVSDAGRMYYQGGLSRDEMKQFYSLNEKEKEKIMNEAFTFNTYGW